MMSVDAVVGAGVPAFEAVPAQAFVALADWLQYRIDAQEELDEHWRAQARVVPALGGSGWPGRCPVCAAHRQFRAELPVRDADSVLREQLRCSGCDLPARQRAGLALLAEGLEPDAAVYLTEQASPAFVQLQRAFPAALGSEYGVDAGARLRLEARLSGLGGIGPIRREDITALTFADASLDAIGSFDVLEHVPDYPRALSEFARCLRPGGRLVLTAPFLPLAQATLVRARLLGNGRIEHLHSAEMHGDPVSGGVLCFYHFGWDLLDATRAAGFSDAQWCRTWSPGQGLFNLWTLRALR